MKNIGNNVEWIMVLVIPMGIYGFLLLDKLIKRLYEKFNNEWCKVGKPCGLFYFPPNSKNFQSMLSLQINIFIWTFKTPKWIKNDATSLSLLHKIRWIFAIGNIAILGLFGFIVIQVFPSIIG